jgi:hypothetical protein
MSDYSTYPPQIAVDVEITEQQDGDRLAYIVGSASVGRYILLGATEYKVLELIGESLTLAQLCDEFKRRHGATLPLGRLQKFLVTTQAKLRASARST